MVPSNPAHNSSIVIKTMMMSWKYALQDIEFIPYEEWREDGHHCIPEKPSGGKEFF